uniref:PSI_integrin domain-containing protein n=1 Tax=Ascaris lumbricoides TaxID=6252 RepID=A0A0M3HXU3_ASCLU
MSSLTECTTFKDCSSCENSMDSLGNCVWCHRDNACYTPLNLCPPKMRAQIPYNCQSNTTTVVQYNETFAKKIALPMMAASAAPDHQAGSHMSQQVLLFYCSMDSQRCIAFELFISGVRPLFPCKREHKSCLSCHAYVISNAEKVSCRSKTNVVLD